MSNYEIIKIKINKNQLKKLKDLKITPQEVFCTGLEEALRKKLKKYISPISDDFNDLIEDEDEYDTYTIPDSNFDKLIISDIEIDNN
jgi:hypothetical protein